MIHELKLTKDEMGLLLEVLESQQRVMATEVAATDALRTKGELRKRARNLDRLIERLRYESTPEKKAV